MKIIKIDEKNIDTEKIKIVSEKIKKGDIVIFPTETVYGIGTNALDETACKKVFTIKGRNEEKPLIVLISNQDMLKNIVKDINDTERKLMETFWPGPLTIILKKQSNISNIVTAGKDEVSVRMTSGMITRRLIEEAGVPIVAPSANLSGMPTGVNTEEIVKQFEQKADYMLDIGNIQSDMTSTIVRVENKKIHIIREGKIKKEELAKIAEVII